MKTFKDNMGQVWTFQLSLGKVRKIREQIGLDVLNPRHYMQILDSLTDRLTYVCLLCEKQAKEFEVGVDEFEERLMGDGFSDAASNALLEETKDFFLKLGQRGMARLAEKSIESLRLGQERIQRLIKTGHFDSLLTGEENQIPTESPSSDGSGSQS